MKRSYSQRTGAFIESTDSGKMWTLITESVPAHLEAGPLVRDPLNAASLYAGFSLLPYHEIWQRSASQRSALAHVSVTSLIAGIFALTVVIAARRRRAAASRPLLSSPGQG